MLPTPIHLLGPGLALALATAAGAQEPSTDSTSPDGAVMARLVTTDGTDVGKVTFQSMRAGMLVQVDFSGLPVGPHAIHIHERGAWNPTSRRLASIWRRTGMSMASLRPTLRTQAICRT